MKEKLSLLASLLLTSNIASAAVYINEILPNAPGGDSPNEFFELRGTPNFSLAGYYLISVEGQGTGKGDINQFFDLSAFSLGANGYLFGKQASSAYTADANATTVQNTIGTGWGQVNGAGSTAGHSSDGTQVDLENSATTFLLVNIIGTNTPSLTNDLDTNNDGFLDLSAGWTVVDSVGVIDGANFPLATDSSYGAITFRAPTSTNASVYFGASAYGNVIDVPGPTTTTAGTFYIARKGESTGSTTNDWVGAIADGVAASPLDFIIYSASDPAYTRIKIADMLYGSTNLVAAPLGTLAYTPTIHGTRFTTNTIVTPGGPVGDIAIDPRDNTTILFTINNDVGGGIYRAYKVASGNWWVDSAPVASGLNRPHGMVIDGSGTIWWVHLFSQSLMRLQAPWSANTPQTVITNFAGTADDDPVDLCFAPSGFSGPPGQPGYLVIADSGSDDNAYNALYLQDPATTPVDFINNTFLVAATTAGLGWDNLRAIDALPQYNEVVTVSTDGYLSGIDGAGTVRNIPHAAFPFINGENLAVDPLTGRVWVSDDSTNEIWSIDPHPTTPTAEAKELSFPLVDPPVPFRSIDMHSPGMAFSTNGAFLVVTDTSTAGGGGRLIIFHSEAIAPYSLSSFSVTNVSSTLQGPKLEWPPAGPANFNLKYVVQRTTNLSNPSSFATINTVTATSYTDTNAPTSAAYYRILAKP